MQTAMTNFIFDPNSIHVMGVNSPIMTPATDVVANSSWYAQILPWLNSSPLHWALIAFAVIMSIQIYQNQKYQRARLGTPLAFAMFIVSVWGAYLYNVWLGGALSLLSLWLIAQSIKFKEEVIEAEEVEEPIRQDQQHIPLKQPLRSIPQSQANMFEGWQPPRIGLGLNI